jgi:hypothetical protein
MPDCNIIADREEDDYEGAEVNYPEGEEWF